MKTPTPTEVKMSALDKRHYTLRKPRPKPVPDDFTTKPSRISRRQKQAWYRQLGQLDLEILGWLTLVVIALTMLLGVPL